MIESGSEMPLAAWLDARLVDVDANLATHVREAIGAVSDSARVRDAAGVLLRAATSRLEPLAAGGCVERESAIELLAVDTLVTLACESLADADASVETMVTETTTMIRAIAGAMPQLDGAA